MEPVYGSSYMSIYGSIETLIAINFGVVLSVEAVAVPCACTRRYEGEFYAANEGVEAVICKGSGVLSRGGVTAE